MLDTLIAVRHAVMQRLNFSVWTKLQQVSLGIEEAKLPRPLFLWRLE